MQQSNAEKALKRYVCDNAKVNESLRNGDSNDDAQLIDTLFVKTSGNGDTLYRGLSADCWREKSIGEDVFESAFSSFSSDINNAISFVRNGGALIVFSNQIAITAIDVNSVLKNSTNDENEYILPRNLTFHIIDIKHYSSYCLFQDSQEFGHLLNEKYPELIDLKVYYVSILNFPPQNDKIF